MIIFISLIVLCLIVIVFYSQYSNLEREYYSISSQNKKLNGNNDDLIKENNSLQYRINNLEKYGKEYHW